ncbi:hypothetical protein ABZ690_33325 [Streptomyces sp. NPDC006967]|uniref:hypothetical protein n=1 Tax=unclassified Streptomyces TaxID=2593676 RepID=UPI0033E246FE
MTAPPPDPFPGPNTAALPSPLPPPAGTVVVDERTGRTGVVMDHVGPYLQLRPVGGGGREWDALPARVRVASSAERLRASVAAANARSRALPPDPAGRG